MKKISKQKGNITIKAVSLYDGIIFSASRVLDEVFQRTGPDVKAEFGKAETVHDFDIERSKIRTIGNEEVIKKTVKFLYAFGLVSFVLAIVSSIKFVYFSIIFKWLFIVSFGSMFTPDVVRLYFMNHFARDEKIRSLARFHGAEHSVINAFYDLRRVPTLEEVKRYSMFSLRCGSLPQVSKLGITLISSIAVLFPSYWNILALAILAVIAITLDKAGKLYFMEFLVVSKPKDAEYEIAIKGLSKAIQEMEENGEPEIRSRAIISVEIRFYETENDERF